MTKWETAGRGSRVAVEGADILRPSFLLLVLKFTGHIVLTLHQPQGDAGAAEQQNLFSLFLETFDQMQ